MVETILDSPLWRVARWIAVSITVLILLPVLWPVLLIMGSALAVPELARRVLHLRRHHALISLIGDALIATMATSLNSQFILMYAPLIAVYGSLGRWTLTTTITLAAAATAIFTDDFMMWGALFALLGLAADAVGQRLGGEVSQRSRLQKGIEVRSDRLSMLSHEIRTPLALIQASVELVLDGAPGPLTPQQRIFMDNIDENSRLITNLAENMLTQSKLEAGLFNPIYQPTDVRRAISAVVTNMRTFTQRRSQTIQIYHPQLVPMVNVDPILLQLVLTNLLRNAIQYTSAGGQIIISVAKNDSGLVISVTDDGAGMTQDQRQKLFQRFSTGGEGIGLGLVIVKNIIELHGGRVYVDTSLGRGTTFFLSLPFRDGIGEKGSGA